MFLDLANLSAITIALPTIQENFDVDVGNLQWMISAYALTFGGFLLLGGRGGDIFGHRRVLLFGMVFFALFSLVCALSPTFIGLVIARAFQGIGAAFTIPPAQAHVALYFTEPTKKAKALGIWGAAGSLGFIIGLILGGVLTAFLGWRWIFWISLIISALVIPAAYLVLPRPRSSDRATTPPPPSDDEPANAAADNDVVPTAPPPPKKLLHSLRERLIRFDAVGISLGVPGILLLTYALTSANAAGWGTASILAPLCVSIALLACFAQHERRAPQAVLAPHLFRNRSFTLTLLLAVLTYAVRQACTYFLTVQLQRAFGLSAAATSARLVPLGVSALVCNTLSGRLVPVLGARAMFVLGWLLATPGVALFALTSPQSSYCRTTLPATVMYIAGIGAVYVAANVVVVSGASRSDQGAAAVVRVNMAAGQVLDSTQPRTRQADAGLSLVDRLNDRGELITDPGNSMSLVPYRDLEAVSEPQTISEPQAVSSDYYTVGWIAALPLERAAAEQILDSIHPKPTDFSKAPNDHNTYTFGQIGEHYIVITSLEVGIYGTNSAANTAQWMLSSFPQIRFGLLVGIGAGIPSEDVDIRLGDVAVSQPDGSTGGVVQYDLMKATSDGPKRKGFLNKPPAVLLSALGKLQAKHKSKEYGIPAILGEWKQKKPEMFESEPGDPGYEFQGVENDRLFDEEYEHQKGKNCKKCDASKILSRDPLVRKDSRRPRIHYGIIASGNTLVKNAGWRSKLLE
ncbi:hypothetical protein SLS58_007108 [Diplodia intermedia]|uniref:Major facilitator superfamily (MFS) profile domain-containing protein n=1 Tax=Diplodia intermedia TaxID=856260 RepID=A0ABR3TLK2_9PEZI